MSSNTLQHDPSGLKLADVLDRLAGALEQQTRTLLDLQRDVGTLAGTVKGIESRLAALDDKRSVSPGSTAVRPDPTTPKAKAKKRPK
jgi:hypothetical protein